MVVREAVKGNGGLCGGVFLDEGFVNLMKSKIGSESWASISIENMKKLMNGEWEHGIKQQFDTRPRDWPVTLPSGCIMTGPSRRVMKKETITLNHSDLLPVFETISQQIIKLIQEQIDGVRATSGKLPKVTLPNPSTAASGPLLTISSTSFWSEASVDAVFFLAVFN